MWSHEDPLYEGPETGSINAVITYNPLGTVESYTVELDKPIDPEILTVEAKEDGIHVSTVKGNLTGLFPIVSITYLEGLEVVEVFKWDDVPVGNRMNGFIAHPSQTMSYTLTCTCEWIPDPLPPVPADIATIALSIVIEQNYDTNRAQLKSAVQREVN